MVMVEVQERWREGVVFTAEEMQQRTSHLTVTAWVVGCGFRQT